MILVSNSAAVNISNLIVDGSNDGIAECSPDLKGILFQNSSGAIESNAVRHIRLSPSPNGRQSGEAIKVETASGLTSTVQIQGNSVWDYQKNGITPQSNRDGSHNRNQYRDRHRPHTRRRTKRDSSRLRRYWIDHRQHRR